jgi:glycosyltransferase involved in cell wall biosynthesis
MIEALPKIVEQHPQVRLVIAGSGPLEAELRACAATHGVTEKVSFLGFRRDAPQLLAAFDVFVHPSLWEGLSISLMEAMIAGCPIVCSRIAGNIEMIRHGENGLLAEPAEPASLAAHVNQMLDNPGFARELARAAKQEGIERFSVERMVRENVAAYDAVIARGVGGVMAMADEEVLAEENA